MQGTQDRQIIGFHIKINKFQCFKIHRNTSADVGLVQSSAGIISVIVRDSEFEEWENTILTNVSQNKVNNVLYTPLITLSSFCEPGRDILYNTAHLKQRVLLSKAGTS